MREFSPQVRRELLHARAILWANALHRTWNRQSNQGASLTDVSLEATSLRKRVQARQLLEPADEARAVAKLLQLPALREDPYLVARLVELVKAGEITLDELQAFMTSSEFASRRRPSVSGRVHAVA